MPVAADLGLKTSFLNAILKSIIRIGREIIKFVGDCYTFSIFHCNGILLLKWDISFVLENFAL